MEKGNMTFGSSAFPFDSYARLTFVAKLHSFIKPELLLNKVFVMPLRLH